MKNSILLASLIIVIGLVLANFMLQDEEILPEAQKMYESANQYTPNEAFEYLYGLGVAVGENPRLAGKKIINEIQRLEQNNQGSQNIDYSSVNRLLDNKLNIELVKSGYETKNTHLFLDDIGLADLSQDEQELLKRFEYLIRLKGQKSLLIFGDAPFPKFQNITLGNKLLSIKAIEQARQGKFQEAENTLLSNIDKLRFQLKQSDTLIHKMIYCAAITDSLNTLSILKQKNKPFFTKKIEPLNPEERNFRRVMTYEFAFNYKILKSLTYAPHNKNPYSIVVHPYIYKPNMSINASYPRYEAVIELSGLDNKVFAESVKNTKYFELKKNYLRNFYGVRMNDLYRADWTGYLSRIFALDAKIALYNQAHNLPLQSDDLSHIKNPFDDTQNAYFLENKTLVCVDILQIQRKKDKCLRLAP